MKIPWSEEQLAVLLKIPFSFDVRKDLAELTDEEYFQIDEHVTHIMQDNFDEDYILIGDGRICYDILAILYSD